MLVMLFVETKDLFKSEFSLDFARQYRSLLEKQNGLKFDDEIFNTTVKQLQRS